MTRRTDMRQTRVMFLTADGAWSVATPFLDQVDAVVTSTPGWELNLRPLSTALHVATSIDDARPNPYLTRLAEMFTATCTGPFTGSAILTGGFLLPTTGTDTDEPAIQELGEWVRPISTALVARVASVVAQVRMEHRPG